MLDHLKFKIRNHLSSKMKKNSRDPEKFDTFELFSSLSLKHHYSVNDPLALNDFISRIKKSLEGTVKNKTLAYGKRTEALFAYVVGALGEVEFIKQEDSGELFFSGEEIQAPDYRLILKNQEKILVEVKNCHNKSPDQKFKLKKDYLAKLKRYADINGLPLRIAIYFSEWKMWCLVPLQVFKEKDDSYLIDYKTAGIHSQMNMLGDAFIFMHKNNIELHLYSEDLRTVIAIGKLEGKITWDIERFRIFSNGVEITNEKEKIVSYYLLTHGKWKSTLMEEMVENDVTSGLKITYLSNFGEVNNCGPYSRIISSVFNQFTTDKAGDISNLGLDIDPVLFSIFAPKDYESEILPITRLHISLE